MTDLLVIAAPTIDVIPPRSKPRPGGPTLYAGYAGRVFGCRARAVGPVGLERIHLVVEAHRNLGVDLEPVAYPGPPYSFQLIYSERGREALLVNVPSSKSLPIAVIASILTRLKPNVVVFAPVGLEVPPQVLPLATLSGASVVALDPQGYSRVFGSLWPSVLQRGSYTFIHYSSDDAQPSEAIPGLVYLTRGVEEGSIIFNGAQIGSIPRPTRILDDPTGAGDAFTALVACCLAREGDPINCARVAVDILPDVLEEAHKTINSLTSVD